LSSHRYLLRRDRSAILGNVTLPSACTRAVVVCACLASLLLTACGAPAATVTPSVSAVTSATPASQVAPFAGSGFRTNIPVGWQAQATNQSTTSTASGTGTVLMFLAAPDHGVLLAKTTPQPVADDQLAPYLASITPAGAVDVSPAEPVDIDGVSGVLVTYTGGTGSATQENEDMVVNQAGNTYEIALSTAPANFTIDSAALQEVLNSWTWA
jgi:hypothetical protein